METKQEMIPIVMHPKAFAAFGADLVTNDVVALIELVKNAYDAFAYDVSVEFNKNDDGKIELIIADNGLGMTKDVIINAWAVIATNNKVRNPYVKRDGETREIKEWEDFLPQDWVENYRLLQKQKLKVATESILTGICLILQHQSMNAILHLKKLTTTLLVQNLEQY